MAADPNNPNKPRAGGVPKTWKKTSRLSDHQRFKMYNPLHMEFKLGATHERDPSDSSINLKRPFQQEIQKMEARKLLQRKRQAKQQIERTMFEQSGHMRVSGAEKTFETTQNEIMRNIDGNSAQKMFSLNLEQYGSYTIDFTRNGQYLALAGSRGHISLMRWKQFRLVSEEYFQGDFVHDIKFCMNESMIATAQREAVYIYNSKCVETHVLRRAMPFPLKLDYLPYHFLLTSIGLQGRLVWFDVSIGKKASSRDTKLGECDQLCSNPSNAVMHAGHKNGVVTLWTPTNDKFVASVLCHKSKITGMAVDHKGHMMATGDQRGNLKIWDLRKFSEAHTLRQYRSRAPVQSCSFAQHGGLLAFGTGRTTVVWNTKYEEFMPVAVPGLEGTHDTKASNGKDEQGEISRFLGENGENGEDDEQDDEDLELLAEEEQAYKEVREHKNNENVYLLHQLERQRCNDIKFCPYEDVLGVGTTKGFVSLVVPGAGEANYDVFESDPFETRNKTKDRVVHQLLDKLRPDMIQLDQNFVGSLRSKSTRQEKDEAKNKEEEMRYARKNVNKNVKNGYRGVLRRRYAKYTHMKDLHHRQEKLRKVLNIRKKIDSSESELRHKIKKQRMVNRMEKTKPKTPSALARFGRKKFYQKEGHKHVRSKFRAKPGPIYF